MLIEQQIQAVAEGLEGRGLAAEIAGSMRSVRPDVFEEPWRTMAVAIWRAPAGMERSAVIEELQASGYMEEEIRSLLVQVAEKGPVRRYRSLQELSAHLAPIEWLWAKWIPRGMITLLGAVPGAGKTFLALDLARRISAGETWPDGSRIPMGKERVVYVDAESVPQIINERVERWGMDKGALYLLAPDPERLFLDFSEEEDRDRLSEMVYHVDPAMVVVDSLSSISSKGENSVEEVRTVLSFLNQLAQDMQCGMVLIHHLRKGSGAGMSEGVVGIDDFRGSGHIIAMSRSVMGLSVVQTGPEMDRNGPRRLEIVKTNLCRYPRALGVAFVPMGEDGVRLEYGDAPEAYRAPTMREQAADWLMALLEEVGEPLAPGEIVELATEEGFSERTVYRARKELGMAMVDTKGSHHPGNRWALAGYDEELGGQ